MSQGDLVKRFIAGLFFIVSIAAIAGSVFVLGVEKGLTEQKLDMTVLFRKVGGLSEGAPVRLSGVTVGAVKDINFLAQEFEGRGVKVVLSLFEKYREQIFKSAKFAIITEGVLGEKVVEITTDPRVHLTDLTGPFIGQDPLDVQDLAENFKDASLAFQEASVGIESITNEIEGIAETTRRLLLRIEQRVVDGNLFKIF